MNSNPNKILVIDDNEAVCDALSVLFSLDDMEVVAAANPEQGLSRLDDPAIGLVVQDMNFTRDTTSGEEGVELFRRIRERRPGLPVILLTAWTHLETAIDLVREGAADYLGKPWDDQKLRTIAHNLLDLEASRRELRRLESGNLRQREVLENQFNLCGIVYRSNALHQQVAIATQVAHADVPVLISGPNGAGKEMLADIVHANSAVADGPYVKVNVGALPADLIEAELFGAEAGAYTGATKTRKGRFETADGGTLFLDEIGNLSADGQAKLLRVIQSGEFQRLGSSATRTVQVRIISATNANLTDAIRRGEFREDLFYRLNVIELHVPALAERPDDILPLAQSFLDREHQLSKDAESALLRYAWPGNVRELLNVVRRACLLSPAGSIEAEALGLNHQAGVTQRDELDEASIRSALDGAGGVVAKAARSLGISRQALYRRMEKFGLTGDKC